MKIPTLSTATVLLSLSLFFVSLPLHAAADTAASLAGILAGMNHFPSDAQKVELAAIAGDTSADDDLRIIAEAIGNIAHQPSEADKQKLSTILKDDAATAAEKTLAGAVLRFNHKAAPEDMAALQTLGQ